MEIKTAIKLAIDNGYKDKTFNLETIIQDDMLDSDIINRVLLDRDFWIAFSKGMGDGDFRSQPDIWKNRWHRLIDFLAEGKTPEKWFESLREPK